MEYNGYFNFENKDTDFHIYRNNPNMPNVAWAVLFLMLIPGLLLS